MSKHTPSYAGLAAVGAVAFLALSWPYGYVVAFQSETNDCFYLLGQPFLLEFLDHPGCLVRYAGRFLGQFYYYPWLGAIVVSACIVCFGAIFHRILLKLQKSAPLAQTLLPCALVLVLQTSTMCVLHDTLGLCAICAAFLLYLSLPGKTLRRLYALAATPVVYFLAGAHVWLFVAWVAFYAWLDGRSSSDLVFKIGYPVFSLAVPLTAWRWVFLIPLRSALACPILPGPPFRTGSPDQTAGQLAADCALAAGLFGLLVILPFWDRLFSRTRLAAFWRPKADKRSRVLLAAALSTLALLLHWIRYDPPLATLVACRDLYKQRQWGALLEKAEENPYGDLRIQFMTNFALWHEGRLLDEMFRYPQPWGTRGLFLNFSGGRTPDPDEDDAGDGMYNSDLLYEMGHANFAFRHAYNCICLNGETYDALARMAECAIVNGNYPMATKYLNLLERTLFYRGLARRYKAIIADPKAVEREFGDLRKRLPTIDGFGHPVRLFVTAFDSRPDNRMALDYMMAWLLLDKRQDSIETICQELGNLRNVGYQSIPRHCQEAMLLEDKVRGAPVDLKGFRYDEGIRARVDEFLQFMLRDGGRVDADRARALCLGTYMYYCFFVTTPGEARRPAAAPADFGGVSREE